MKDDFFAFNDTLGTEEPQDELGAFPSFANLHDDVEDDADLLSNWSLGRDQEDDDGFVCAQTEGQLSRPQNGQVAASTLMAGFQAEFSLVEPIIANSLWMVNAPGEAPSTRLQLPDLNDEIFGFRLLYELGAGAFAKVFLAMQGDLADREVVLKISAIEGSEPQTLAQLQHTHVVPIYSVHEDTHLGLRAACMPYFGGASLSRVLEDVWGSKQIPTSGQTLLSALDRVAGPEPATKVAQRIDAATTNRHGSGLQSVHSVRNVISELSYVQTAAWIICRLAEGLQHSHERDVIHRDIKPSNILMSAEGQPLLLDFNVSQAVDCKPDEASMGGTLSYMAPEHLRAMLNHDASDTKVVNHRSDIYALGLVLYEMLAGVNPFAESKGWLSPEQREALLLERERPVPSLKQRCRLEIPWSLESIVRKCMAPCPLDRYVSAAQLAEDLTRFLQDQPLKYAPELSRCEQIRKWVRRHPRLTTTGIAMFFAAALIIPGGILLTQTREDLATKQNLLISADSLEIARNFRMGMLRSRYQINTATPNQQTLRDGVRTAEETLGLYAILNDEQWQKGTYWRNLNAAERDELGENVRELLMLLADARSRLAAHPKAVAIDALQLLDRAGKISDLQPSRALLLDRARYLTLLRRDRAAEQIRQRAEQIPVVTAHDIYMLGAAYAREGKPAGYQQAVKLLTESIDQDRQNYWAYFERGLCQQELGRKLEALSDFSVCAGLWTESAWAHFNLGCVMAEQHGEAAAIEHYTAAIKCDPQFKSAYFNRGLASLETRNFERALKDFEKVQELGRDDAVLAAAQAMSLEGLGRHADADRLFAQALDRAESGKQSQSTSAAETHRISWTYAFSVAPRAPQVARRVFDTILTDYPEHPQALYGQGMLSMQHGQLDDAVRWFDRAIGADSRLIEPVRYRAVCFARLGKLQAAAADANACLDREEKNPESLYVAACVASLSARKLNSAKLRDYALDVLHQALEQGTDQDREALRERAAADPDLSALKDDPDFQQLIGIGNPPQSSENKPTL